MFDSNERRFIRVRRGVKFMGDTYASCNPWFFDVGFFSLCVFVSL
jgi:hypothetical protein